MAKLECKLVGKDADLVEPIARELCLRSGGNCLYGKSCGSRAKCPVEGWQTMIDDAETALDVIRETHKITIKGQKP